MSQQTLPLLVLNLGGEMIHILEQSLLAHDDGTRTGVWTEDNRRTVLRDLLNNLFSPSFLQELLAPQDAYSPRALKSLLTRLAHTSVLRLHPISMDRMYEQMTMTFKQQVLLCPRPQDLLLITFSHMDSLRRLSACDARVELRISQARQRILEVYAPLCDGEFQLIRQTLLLLLQDTRGGASGGLVMPARGCGVPGSIRCFSRSGVEVKRSSFSSGGEHSATTDMHCSSSTADTSASTSTSRQQLEDAPNPLATEELKLLQTLVGAAEQQNLSSATFRLKLCVDEQDQNRNLRTTEDHDHHHQAVVEIQVTQDARVSGELARIAAGLAEARPGRGQVPADDLLALMDETGTD